MKGKKIPFRYQKKILFYAWILMIVFFLAWAMTTLYLVPGVVYGPDFSNTLKREECLVLEVEYRPNHCLIEPDPNSFSQLYYTETWEDCTLAFFNLTTSSGNQCQWFFPGRFIQVIDARVTVEGQNYIVGFKYPCVHDTIRAVCFPDEHETLIFVSAGMGTLIFFLISVIVYCGIKCVFERNNRAKEVDQKNVII